MAENWNAEDHSIDGKPISYRDAVRLNIMFKSDDYAILAETLKHFQQNTAMDACRLTSDGGNRTIDRVNEFKTLSAGAVQFVDTILELPARIQLWLDEAESQSQA